MKHPDIVSARRSRPPSSTFAPSLLVAMVLLLTPAAADANQVFKACGKSWVKQTKKLSPEQLDWRMKQRFAEAQQDLDGDGLLDTLVLTNWPSYRDCDLKKTWHKKEITLRIEYGHGKIRIVDWIDDQLVERMKVYAELGRILIVGVDSAGEAKNRWVQYRKVETPLPSTSTAGVDPSPSETQPIRIAGLR